MDLSAVYVFVLCVISMNAENLNRTRMRLVFVPFMINKWHRLIHPMQWHTDNELLYYRGVNCRHIKSTLPKEKKRTSVVGLFIEVVH